MSESIVFLIIKALGAFAFIIGGYLSLKIGTNLFKEGTGLQKTITKIELPNGIKIFLSSVGSLVLLSSALWAYLGYSTFPKTYKLTDNGSNGTSTEIANNGNILNEMDSSDGVHNRVIPQVPQYRQAQKAIKTQEQLQAIKKPRKEEIDNESLEERIKLLDSINNLISTRYIAYLDTSSIDNIGQIESQEILISGDRDPLSYYEFLIMNKDTIRLKAFEKDVIIYSEYYESYYNNLMMAYREGELDSLSDSKKDSIMSKYENAIIDLKEKHFGLYSEKWKQDQRLIKEINESLGRSNTLYQIVSELAENYPLPKNDQ